MTLAATAAALTMAVSLPVQADHANPWATEEDSVLAKNHDANQARSIGTPGEDEMRGVMTRSAHGKLDTDGTGARDGDAGGGNSGGGGNGGNGNGGGGPRG